MPNKQNVETLATIKEELKDVSAMWIVDYRGLTVKEIQELRRNIRESGAKMTVWKNTIMKLAMDELKLPDLGEILTGPSAFVVAPEDPVGSAKAIRDFAKKNEALEIKGGIMDGEFVVYEDRVYALINKLLGDNVEWTEQEIIRGIVG